jgi:3-oxoacyl-[acyl-carrier protein] reductase
MDHALFTGQVALITGAAHGVGETIALRLAAGGANIVIADVDGVAGERVARQIRQQGGYALYVPTDVTAEDDVEALCFETVKRYGRLDVVVNNVGVYPSCPVSDLTETEWQRVLDMNLKSAFLVSKASLRHMAAAGYGRVVYVSSVVGAITGQQGWSHYAASKAGLIGFMRSAALEYAAKGITLNAVLPGFIDTPHLRAQFADGMDKFTGSIPAGHLGSANDVAHAVAFLAANDARFITGQTLVVDGGQTLPNF